MRLLIRSLFLLALSISAAWADVPLPEVVTAAYGGLKPQGEARLRVFGFHIYDSSLWVSGDRYSPDELFALDICYARNFKGTALAEQSIKEWRRMGSGNEAKYQRWLPEMLRVFPDVKPGDHIVGISVPGKGARFYSTGKLLGNIDDWEFAQAFFAIWLDPRTREPTVRYRLLGKK